ncbi:MAG: DUF4350 domain-containing protein [Verrucomicrobia bacterium]|nr:DUF4350 domain-containing protein [Verrucomicrobiota bacterium]
MKRSATILGLVLVVAASLWALAGLIDLRLTSGDVYPPYSSLRSDPLGAKAVYETLENLPRLTTGRYLRHPRHLPNGRGAGLWVLGLPATELNGSPEESETLERFARQGGRVVVALDARSFQSWRMLSIVGGTNTTTGTNALPPRMPFPKSASEADVVDFQKQWGFHLRIDPFMASNGVTTPVFAQCVKSNLDSPPLIWRSQGYFAPAAAEWRAIARRGSNIVVMERSLGQGTLVLASDTYLLSNEALRHQRAADFLAWLIGDSTRILFNETHHGIQENPGVTTLIRRYRLGYLFAALGGLAALFIWQGTVSFLPDAPAPSTAVSAGTRGRVIRGRGGVSGLIGLLRRSVAPSRLMARCLEEWNRSQHGDRHLSPERLGAVQDLIDRENARPASQRNSILLYRAIASVVRLSRSTPNRTPVSNP